MQLADPDGLARLGAACRAHDVLLICDEVATGFGRTGTLFASEQCGLVPRPAVPRQGHHRRLPRDVGDGRERPRVRRVPRRRPRPADALPRALLRRERARRRGRAAPPRADRRVGRARNVRERSERAARAAPRPRRVEAGREGDPAARADGRRRARAAAATGSATAGASSPRRPSGACCCARSATWSCSCRRSRSPSPEVHRIVDTLADAIDEVDRAVTWRDWADDERDGDPGAGRWRGAARPRRARARRHARRRPSRSCRSRRTTTSG